MIDEIEAEIAPKLAAHSDAIQLNPKLFAKIKSLHENCGSLNLNSEDSWLLEKYYRDLVHAGAHLSDEERLQLTGINEELSKLQTAFGKNLLNDTNDLAVMVENLADLDGLTAAEIATASNAAKDRGHEGKYLLAMVNFTGNPLLTTLKNRELRKRLWMLR